MTGRQILLLVGPSGVGKSTVCRTIEDRFTDTIFRHLDGLASGWAVELGWLESQSVGLLRNHIGDDQLLFAFGMESIGMFAGRNTDKNIVIDVGAGFQDARSAENLHRIHKTVTLTADPVIVYEMIRNRSNERRSFEEYKRVEFSERRVRVYARSLQTIDCTSLDHKETANKLIGVLRAMGF